LSVRPRIGITCDFETIIDRRGDPLQRYVASDTYVEAVVNAGGLSVLLPHVTPEHAGDYLEMLDGIVIAGGAFDVPPSYYGQEPRAGLGRIVDARSAFERELITHALARDVPLLGVCGGMQLLNVVLGGTLHQDLAERPGTGVHMQLHDRRQPSHGVTVSPGSLLARLTGLGSLAVNSTHHQVVDALGNTLVASAVADDGVIEAIESTQHRHALGVQWHPEALGGEHAALYRWLVEAAAVRP
jgi:putative glutamine amidotransferase